LHTNKVYSDNTELSFTYSELPFVCPASGRRHPGSLFHSGTPMTLSLGEILRGDRITLSDYELVMGTDDEAHYLCSVEVDQRGVERAREIIRDRYVAEWIVDNLPGATTFVKTDKSSKYYAAGFKLGYEDVDPQTNVARYFINNHVTLVIRYHRAPGKAGDRGKKVIVGFEVYPKSIEAGNRNDTGIPLDIQHPNSGLELTLQPNTTTSAADSEPSVDTHNATLTIPYTYSVYFQEEPHLEWQNRWSMYFVNQDENDKIHWLAIVNSIVILGLLTAVVAVIFARTIRGDLQNPKITLLEEGKLKKRGKAGTRSPKKSIEKGGLLEQLGDVDADADISSDEEILEDITGWKLVHGDVFRAPVNGSLLAPLVGSGMQLVFMCIGLLLLSCFGILNPSLRGGYINYGVALFVIAGLFSGYFSGRVYKTFGGQRWQKNVLVTSTLIPGLLFCTIFILNLFVWAQASSTAIPFGTLIVLLILWLLVQLPLVYVGSWLGYVYSGAYEHPIKTNAIPRQIPSQSWYRSGLRTFMLAGLIPFAVVFIELLFVFKSLWQDKSGFYYVFGFLAVVSIILVITVIEVTVVATYVQLCSEVSF